jgi:hypothetical protein
MGMLLWMLGWKMQWDRRINGADPTASSFYLLGKVVVL